MNAASWGLLPKGFNVARTNVGRVLRRPCQRLSFSSTSHSLYGSTFSFRLAHPVDFYHTTAPSNADFPVNIIDRQQSLHALSTLISQGDLDQARQTLANILEGRPMDGDIDVFQQIKTIIAPLDSESPPVDLIMQLGNAAASRGYVTFARTEILPLLDEFGTEELASQLDRELLRFETSRQRLQSSNDVFEGASDDYIAILSGSKPIQASPVDLMLRQLPILLPEPEPNDCAIFEDEEETAVEQMSMDPLVHADKTSVGMLQQILLEKKWDHAYEFLQQILETEVQITPHPIYGQAALAVLNAQDELPADKFEEFKAWLPLIPPFNVTAYRPATLSITAQIMNILLRYLKPNIRMIMHVALVFTSKGYSVQLSEVVEVIVSSLHTKQCRLFVKFFEQCEADFFLQSDFPETLHNSRNAAFHNTVVQTLILCDRLEEAKRVLSTMAPSSISADTQMYLRQPDDVQETGGGPEGKNKKKTFTPSKYLNHSEIFFPNLVTQMRYLKNMFHKNTNYPNPLVISKFMARYISSGRSFALQILANKAFRCNRGIICSMILGEMILYRSMKLPELVLETFVHHFYLYDVPEKLVLNLYRESKRRRLGDENAVNRIIIPKNRSGIITRKLWPQSGHYNLIWEILIEKTNKDPNKMKALYEQFIHTLTHRPKRPHTTPNDKRLGASTDKSQFTSSSFTPFFRPMMSALGYETGQKIFNHMLDLRITPELPVYSELAGQLAKYGQAEQVFDIIDRLEAGGVFHTRGTDHPVPEPDLPFYVNVLRGFLIREDATNARKVFTCIEKMFPDAHGEVYTKAVEDLRNLEAQGNERSPLRRPYYRNKPKANESEKSS